MRIGTVLALACTLSCWVCYAHQQRCYYDTISAVSGVGLQGDTLVMTSGRIFPVSKETQRAYHWLPDDRVLICYRHNDVAHRDDWEISSIPGAITSVPQHHW